MERKKKSHCIVLFALLWSTNLFAESIDFEKLVPAKTELLFLTQSWLALNESLSKNPIHEALDRKEIRDTLSIRETPLTTRFWEQVASKKTGLSLDHLKQLFNGQLLLAIPRVDTLFSNNFPAYTFVAETGDSSELLSDLIEHRLILEDSIIGEETDPIISEESYFNTTLNMRQYETNDGLVEGSGWAIIDNVVVIARPASQLRSMVASIKQGASDDNWADEDTFQIRDQRSEPWGFITYLKGSALEPLVQGYFNQIKNQRLLAAQERNNPDDSDQLKSNSDDQNGDDPMGMMVTQTIQSIFGDSLQGIVISSYIGNEHSGFDLDLFHDGEKRYGGLFSYNGKIDQLPQFTPADSNEVTVSKVDYQKIWEWLKSQEADGNFHSSSGDTLLFSLLGAAESIGAEVKNQLLESIGPSQLTYSVVGESIYDGERYPDSTGVVVQEVEDTAGLLAVMDKLHKIESWQASLETESYLDTPVHIFMQGQGDERQAISSYAISDGQLIYSRKVSEVQSLLGRLNQGSNQDSLWEQPAIKKSLKTLPSGYSAVSYDQPDTFIKSIYNGLRMIPNSKPPSQTCEVLPKLEEDAFVGFLGSVLSATYQYDRNIQVRIQLPRHSVDES